ncbi:MAG: DUF1615 family protein [Moraxella sp.]|nr:DUF1615 family protein [Moraxella sp.]
MKVSPQSPNPSRWQVSLFGMVLSLPILNACTPPADPKPALTTEHIAKVLPERKQDKSSWATDIAKVFDELKIDKTAQNICTAVAIIDQESNFAADPAVPNLGATSLKALEDKLDDKLGKTLASLFKQMLATRPTTDNSFERQIKAVKTERELDELYRQMFEYFATNYKMAMLTNTAKTLGQGIDERLNPITTLGSMQVHIDYAKRYRRANMNNDELRADLYSQYGGLYYGIHRLMVYQAEYDKPIYRFADYNSGMYSSRNAAVQAQIAKLTGRTLTLDGDLLLYAGGSVKSESSQTEQAIVSLLPRLTQDGKPLTATQVRKDLKKEKRADFELTATYKAIKELYVRTTNTTPVYATMPKVAISSPKLSKDYDTNWFASNVNKRYERCMGLARKYEQAK